VNVTWANEAPQATVHPSLTVNGATVVTLDGSGSSDPDDGIATFRWHQTGGAPVTLSDPTAAKPTFIAPTQGADGNPLTFRLTVTDTGQMKSTATQVVTVNYKGPDLAGKWTSLSYANSKIAGTLQVSNIGNQKASSFTTAFYLSKDGISLTKLLTTQSFTYLNAGQSTAVNLQYSGANLRRKYIIAVIDSSNSIRETNEINNVAKALIP
jgi:hypothetical protein